MTSVLLLIHQIEYLGTGGKLPPTIKKPVAEMGGMMRYSWSLKLPLMALNPINLIGFVRNGVQNLSWKTLFGLELIWRAAIL